MEKFKSVDEMVNQLKPTEPVYCIRRKSIQLASKYFPLITKKILTNVQLLLSHQLLGTIIQKL